LKLQILQHVPFEGPANIAKWALEHKHELAYTKMYEGNSFPKLEDFDLLVVMGGPMGLADSKEYPWVSSELQFIKDVIDADKKVLGICLGAQFIAKALGANVYKGPNMEIGWFPLIFENNLPIEFHNVIPESIQTFHWHGDTFDIPTNAIPLAHSEGTPNQGFIYNKKVWALQFHIEMNSNSINTMLEHFADHIDGSIYTQTPEIIQQGLTNEKENYRLLTNILTYLSGRIH
jgi:GMP synthase (glutamine-hydrolysing)